MKEIEEKKSYKEILIDFFKYIKSVGWVPFTRNQINSDGLLGNILEDLIGIKENNQREADFHGYEIKTKNNDSDSLVTLFGATISSVKKANTEIREKYGIVDGKSNLKIFNSTIHYHKWNTHRAGFGYKLEKEKNKLYLKIKDLETNLIVDDNRYYWNEEDIKQFFKNKVKNLCLVEGILNKENKLAKFNKMYILEDSQIEKFWDLLYDGSIALDFRIGVYKSGKNIGKTHDHGTSFRIKKNKIKDLYKKIIEI